MTTILLAALGFLLFIAGIWVGSRATDMTAEQIITATTVSPIPQIVVQMPQGAEPLARLTEDGGKVIPTERALLWWTVFKHSFDHPDTSMDQCIEAADRAVERVYGD